ncbi:MAG TPA: hypothetical protein VN680_10535 [Burkholderiaceae bacterium]|jgi:hypothetical protein|nr:hypothetical protein [Burkholderiaceae bacterium]
MTFARTLESFAPAARRRLIAAAACIALGLGACGGGFYVAYGFNNFDDAPPNVSLAVNVVQARPGDVVRLVAAASDDRGVAVVSFFRIDPAGGAPFALGDLSVVPYQVDTQIPADAAGTVQYFARAGDRDGHFADSNIAQVLVVNR